MTNAGGDSVTRQRGGVRKTVGGVLAILGYLAFLAAVGQGQNISTVAGGGPPNGVSATSVPIGLPWGVVQDSSGNTYVTDRVSSRVFKFDSSSSHLLTIVAGNGINNFAGDGGAATSASLSNPQGIALDGKGGLYIADTGNNVIRVVNVGASAITLHASTGASITINPGNIATVAGTGAPCSAAPCGDGGLAAGSTSTAELTGPSGVAVDGNGNIFIADTGDSVIREVVAATGKIQAAVGVYAACTTAPCGDGSPAASAHLNAPAGVFVDAADNLYIADTGDQAIRVANFSGTATPFFGVPIASGNIGTVAGTLLTACSVQPGCGDGSSAITALLDNPSGAYVSSGTLWIADSSNQAVRSVSSSGTILLVAGDYSGCATTPCGDGGSPTSAQLSSPASVFVAGSNVFIADLRDDAIREVTSGKISTFAGIQDNESLYGDGGPATPKAEIQKPGGVSTDSAGNLYIADSGNSVIRKVDAKGNISTVVGNGVPCIVSPSPTCGDGGAAAKAQLFAPSDVFVSGSAIYVADSADNVIRVANTGASTITVAGVSIGAGNIATIAGDGKHFKSGYMDGAVASSLLNNPFGVFVDSKGTIYVADSGNSAVRAINPGTSSITVAGVSINGGSIATIAGTGKAGFSGDNGPATKAQLNNPASVFVDSSGKIYVSDGGVPGAPGNNRVRTVSTSGTITTVAGDGTSCSTFPCGDGGPATKAQMSNVWGVFVDTAGDIFISDGGDSLIREVTTDGNITTVAGDGLFGFSGDGGKATSAALAKPAGLWGDASGNLLIADFGEWRVREVAGIVKGATSTTLTSSANPAGLNQSITFTATVTSSSALKPTGTVTFMDGATALGSPVTLNGSGAATLTISTLKAGTHSITAVYSGDSNFAGSTSSPLNEVVQSLTATTTTLTLSSAGVTVGASVTFTAKVAHASGAATPTGTVTFNNGGTKLGSGTLSSGTATFTTSSLAAGSYSVTADYSGDSNYAASTSTAAPLNVEDFKIAANPTTVTVSAPGQNGTTTLTITPEFNFNPATLSYSCSGLPSGANCAFSVASATTETVTISTTAASAKLEHPFGKRADIFYALLLPGLLGIVAMPLGSRKRMARNSRLLILLAILAMAVLWMPACGGGSGGGGGGGNGGTPTGSSTVTITATTGGASPLSHTTQITLTVQ
jgi:hypothetical protein